MSDTTISNPNSYTPSKQEDNRPLKGMEDKENLESAKTAQAQDGEVTEQTIASSASLNSLLANTSAALVPLSQEQTFETVSTNTTSTVPASTMDTSEEDSTPETEPTEPAPATITPSDIDRFKDDKDNENGTIALKASESANIKQTTERLQQSAMEEGVMLQTTENGGVQASNKAWVGVFQSLAGQTGSLGLSATTAKTAEFYFLQAAKDASSLTGTIKDAAILKKIQASSTLGYSAIFEELLANPSQMRNTLTAAGAGDGATLATATLSMLSAGELALPTAESYEEDENGTTSAKLSCPSSYEMARILGSFAANVSNNQYMAAEYSSLAADVASETSTASTLIAQDELDDLLKNLERQEHQRKKCLFKLGKLKVKADDLMQGLNYTAQSVAIVALVVAAPTTGGTSLIMAGAMAASLGATAGGQGNFLNNQLTKAFEAAGMGKGGAQMMAGITLTMAAAAAGGAMMASLGGSALLGALSMGSMFLTSSSFCQGTAQVVGHSLGLSDQQIMILAASLSAALAIGSIVISYKATQKMIADQALKASQSADEVANAASAAQAATNTATTTQATADAASRAAATSQAAAAEGVGSLAAADEMTQAANTASKTATTASQASREAQTTLAQAQEKAAQFQQSFWSRAMSSDFIVEGAMLMQKVAAITGLISGTTTSTLQALQGMQQLHSADLMMDAAHSQANLTLMRNISTQMIETSSQITSNYSSAVQSLSQNQATCTQMQAEGMQALSDELAKM